MFLFPQIKQRPIQGFMGFGGGATGLAQKSGSAAGPAGHEATGGIISEYTDPGDNKVWRCHVFEQPGDFVVSSLSASYPTGVEYLVIAGGGAAGARWHGGGGGAGGMLSTHPDITPLNYCNGAAMTVSAQTYKIAVGPGAAATGQGTSNQVGYRGEPSSIKSPTATIVTTTGGGGGGCSGAPAPQEDGGAGGGGGGGQTSNKGEGTDYPGSDQQGFPGGNGGTRGGGSGGGGGGSGMNGAAGSEGSPTQPYSNGGVGLRCRIGTDPTHPGPNAGGGLGAYGRNPGQAGGSSYSMFGGGGGGAQGDEARSGVGGGWYPGPGWMSPPGPFSGGGGSGTFNPVTPSKSPSQPTTSGESGYHNTGGGGGATHQNGPGVGQKGGSGGSGIVAIRYQIGSPTEGGTTDDSTANATGGLVSFYNSKTIHTFTTPGTFATTANWSAATVEYVIIAGGGGGGSLRTGGGGGAGGYLTGTTPIGAHPISFALGVGCGGSSDNSGQPSPVAFPAGTLIAEGGGRGGNSSQTSGNAGGSGGGARSNDSGTGGEGSCQAGPQNGAATAPQGNSGGPAPTSAPAHVGGGGGGAGGAGVTGSGSSPNAGLGFGGAGVQLPATFRNPQSVLGTVDHFPYDPADPGFSPGPGWWVAGGGGGGHTGDQPYPSVGEGRAGGGRGGAGNSPYPDDYGGVPGWSGIDGTGGGGGGSYGAPGDPTAQRGGNGGAGIVLIAYPT